MPKLLVTYELRQDSGAHQEFADKGKWWPASTTGFGQEVRQQSAHEGDLEAIKIEGAVVGHRWEAVTVASWPDLA